MSSLALRSVVLWDFECGRDDLGRRMSSPASLFRTFLWSWGRDRRHVKLFVGLEVGKDGEHGLGRSWICAVVETCGAYCSGPCVLSATGVGLCMLQHSKVFPKGMSRFARLKMKNLYI